jgi:hypothetical protein
MKKKMIIAIAAISISSCAVLDAYLIPKYDPMEYQIITSISALAEISISQCNNPNNIKKFSDDLLLKATEFKNYTAIYPNNTDAVQMSTNLLSEIKGLSLRYNSDIPVSATYCKEKITLIEHSAKNIQTVLGAKSK